MPATTSSDRAPRRPRGAQTRTRLLKAAHDAFAELGYAHTRVADIARRAGTSHGTFYTYFTDKQDAFLEVSDQVAGALEQATDATLTGDGAEPTPATRLRSLLDALSTEPGVLLAWRQASALDQAADERLKRFHNALAASLARSFQHDQEHELIVRDIDVRLAATAILHASQGLVLDRAQPTAALDAHSIEQITNLWLRALYRSNPA